METVTSQDGTRIAYDRSGHGPALILVSGALGERAHGRVDELVEALAPHFTVISYDRRGRGDSGDTLPYAVEREVEDLAALIEAAGGQAAIFGMSSGAMLALEAASRLPGKVRKLVLYEPPLILDDSRAPVPEDYGERVGALAAEGRRGDAVELFMREAVGVPPQVVAHMRGDPQAATPPEWAGMERLAHTLAYDFAVMRGLMSGKPLPAGRWAGNTAPTLILTGGNSLPFFHTGARALAQDLPDAQHDQLPGQDHAVQAGALAPRLVEFLSG